MSILQLNNSTMRVLLIFGILLIVTIALSCASKKANPSSAKDTQLYFGSGGGFSGISKDFRLSANGHIQQKPSITAAWGDLGKVPNATTKQLFSQVEQLGIAELKHDYPSNRYYYIETRGDVPNKVMWGNPDHPPAEEIRILHSILMKLTARKN